MPGSVISVQVCLGDRGPMRPLPDAEFDPAGIVGDSHRGSETPVLLQDEEDLKDLDLVPGVIRENVTVRGVGVNRLPPGTRLSLGQVVLEITKDCRPCSLMEDIRPGLRRELRDRRGMYARVVEAGVVRVGDPASANAPAPEGAP